MNEKFLRLFYALWPNQDVRVKLQALQQYTQGRYTRPENLHITLAFLGQQTAGTLPALKDILADLPDCAIDLPIDRLGYFKKNRIAWAGTRDAPPALLALRNTLMQALDHAGIACDRHTRFKPHVTLAREADAPPELNFEPIAWRNVQAALVESTQVEGVLTYRVLAARPLSRAK